MARARMIKPEFFEDEKLGRVSRDARLMYPGLWTLADDDGNVKAEPVFIRNRLFPYDDDVSVADVSRWLDELAGIGRVELYEVNDEKYAAIPKFQNHQVINRPSKWRNPVPSGALPDSSVSTHTRLTDEIKTEVQTEVEVKTEVRAPEERIEDVCQKVFDELEQSEDGDRLEIAIEVLREQLEKGNSIDKPVDYARGIIRQAENQNGALHVQSTAQEIGDCPVCNPPGLYCTRHDPKRRREGAKSA